MTAASSSSAPARPRARGTACRDCVGPASDVFYSTQPGDGEINRGDPNSAFPALLSVQHYDKPGDNWALVETNSLTGLPNYLEAAQLEFSFCTVLSLRDPTGAFRHLSHFYWNVNWQAQFQRVHAGGFRVIPDANGTSANVGGPIRGASNDPRFVTILTSAQSRNCNDFAAAETQAVAAPGNLNRRESRTWTNFDVTR